MNARRQFLFFLFILLCIINAQNSFAQFSGLGFAGHEVPLDQRTSLNLTPDKPIYFTSDIKLSFNLKFEPDYSSYFGYIFRAIIDDQNIDFIYSPQSMGGNTLHIVIGEKISKISIPIPLTKLLDDWNFVELEIKKADKQIRFKFNDQEFYDNFRCKDGKSNLFLFFGAHMFNRFSSTDVPEMDIKNITLTQSGKLLYSWPLDQQEGTRVKEVIHSFDGIVANPHWKMKMYSNWEMLNEFHFPGKILYAYDDKLRTILIIQADSLYKYGLDTKRLSSSFPKYDLILDNRLNLIYDSTDSRFLLYSPGLNLKCEMTESSKVAQKIKQTTSVRICWHHNPVINPEDNILYVFGGYGQYIYSNTVAFFNDKKDKWDTIKYNGIFHPRYLAGAGYNPKDRKLYIIGGYGSRSGDQTISPGYYYDLVSYSFEENRFETLFEYPENQGPFCFAKTLFIDTLTNTLYGLKFSKFETTTDVQAVSVSLDDYKIKNLGNPFSFEFLDISSTIDMFFDPIKKNLIAITTFFNDGQTKVNLFQLAYPPLEIDNSYQTSRYHSWIWLVFILMSVLLISFLLIMITRKSSKSKSRAREDNNTPTFKLDDDNNFRNAIIPENRSGSILIFGGFQVINKEGEDITNSFTPLLKEMFLLIMLSSLRHGKGVSSGTLDEIFWFDKSEKAARNNRSVNIGKLKSLLETVGDCRISKNTGYWKFEIDPSSIYLDYYEYLMLLNTKKLKTKAGISTLLNIIHMGPALQNTHADWLDKFKQEISNEIIDNILDFISNNIRNAEPDFLIHLADCIFFFDMVNEEAMNIKCKILAGLGKHGMAKTVYQNFIKDYKNLYDEDFGKSFNQILEE